LRSAASFSASTSSSVTLVSGLVGVIFFVAIVVVLSVVVVWSDFIVAAGSGAVYRLDDTRGVRNETLITPRGRRMRLATCQRQFPESSTDCPNPRSDSIKTGSLISQSQSVRRDRL
jgi:hypothetical protein